MPEGINSGTAELCDNVARRAVAEVRHELRNFQAVSDIKVENLKVDLDRTAREVKGELERTAQDLKSDTAKSAASVKTNFEEKHATLTTALTKIESLMKWAGSLIVSLILGVLGWSLLQQVQNNEQQKRDLQSQIKLLEEQDRTRLLANRNAEILRSVAPEQSQASSTKGP